MRIQRAKKYLFGLGILICLGLFSLFAKPVFATNPNLINFQGKVVNANGTNVSNGTYNFDFVLYDDASLGSPSDGVHDKWHELTKSVTVTNGVFQTELGSATALPDFNANSALYLAIRFNADAAGYMTPRVHLDSVPYALNSDKLSGLTSGSFVQLAQGLQTDSSTTNPSIFINKTNASGTPNILELQKSGVDVFKVDNAGLITAVQGLTLTGTTLINNTGTASTTIGNSAGGTITIGASSGSNLILNDADWSVTGAGNAAFAQVTSPTYTSTAALALTSGGAGALTLTSGSGTIALGSNTVQRSAAGLTLDVLNGAASTLTVTNSNGSFVAGLDVEGGVNIGSGQTYKINNTQITSAALSNDASLVKTSGNFTLAGNMTYNGTSYHNLNSTTALKVEQNGVKNNVLIVDTTNGMVGVNLQPSTTGSALQITGGVQTTEAAPASNSTLEGTITYDTTTHKFVVYEGAGAGTKKTLCNLTDLGCGAGGTTTLQNAYDATSGNTIATTTGRNLAITLSHAGTDADFTVNAVTNSTSLVKFTYNSTNVLQIDPLNNRVAVGSNGTGQTAILSVAGNSGNAFSIMDGSNGALFNADTTSGFVINNGVTSLNNDVSNPSFEGTVGTPYSGWNGSGVITSAADSRTGQRHYELTSASDVNSIKYYEVTPGDAVYFEGYMKASAGATGSAGFFIQWFDYNKSSVGFTNVYDASYSTSYAAKTTSTVAPAGAVYARINMTYRAGATGTFYYDDIFFGKSAFPGPMLYKNTVNSTSALQVQNATTTAAILNVDTTNSQVSVQGINSDAVLGAELFTGTYSFPATGGWTAISGTGSSATATHTAGGGTTALSPTPAMTITAGVTYKVKFTVTGNPTIPETIKPKIGGVDGSPISYNSVETQLITATGTGNLTFTPTNNWNGTISAVSIQAVTFSNAALKVQTSGAATAIEVRASTAFGNTLIGVDAGKSITAATNSTAFGVQALEFTTTGNQNTAIGNFTLQNNTTGYSNSGLGVRALMNNTTGYNNVAIGVETLLANTTGADNIALGTYSLTANTVGFANAAFGSLALQANTIGNFNLGLGESALQSNTTGSNNTAVGGLAGYTNTSANANTTGASNTFLGYNTGPGSTTQFNNAAAIGANATVNQSDSLVLGCINTVNGCTASTKVGIGTATPAETLDVRGTAYFKAVSDSSNLFEIDNSSGLNISNINTNTTANLVSNPSFESNANGWAARNTATIAYDNTAANAEYGSATLKVTNAAANDGAKFTIPLKANTTYSATFWAKVSTGTATAIFGRQDNGSDSATCSSLSLTTTWTQFTCANFTTGGTVNGTTNIYITVSGTTTITYIDGVTLTQAATGLTFDAGGNNFNVQSLNSNVTINGANTGDVQPWQLSPTAITTGSRYAATANANGYMYYIGGCTGACGSGTQLTTVYYSKISSDGSLNTWTAANALPAGRYGHTAFVSNGYLYVVGGDSGAGALNATPTTTVYYSKLNGDGTIGTWQTNSNVLPAAREFHTSAVSNGFAYVVGGDNVGTPQSTAYYAKVNADGSTGAWATTTPLTTGAGARRYASTVIANGYIYVLGGDFSGTTLGTVFANSINADGTLGASWIISTPLTQGTGAARQHHSSVLSNGYIYVIGGDVTGTAQNTVYYAKVLSNGILSNWQTATNSLPAIRTGQSSTLVNGYMYALGGYDGTAAAATPYYASTSRVLLGGTLDLVGLSGQGLSDIGGAGAITAGNIRAVGDLRVDGYADFNNGISVDSAINLNAIGASAGQTVFNINNLNSNSIFSIRHMSTNFGSLIKGGAFEGRNSYFGEEFNVGKLTACGPLTGAIAGASINAFARGDSGGQGTAGVCSGTANATINGGELNASTATAGTTTFGSCTFASPGVTTVNGVERITATSVNTVNSSASCVENLAGTTTTSNKILLAANLPVVAMKVKPSTLASAAAARVQIGMMSGDSASGSGVNSPAQAIYFTNCSTWNNAAVPTGCSNTTWYGVTSTTGAGLATVVTCSVGSGSLTANFSYLRIEVRSATDVHFFADYNTADGINESECGTGSATNITASALTPWMQSLYNGQAVATTVLDVDYFRSWQDDNVPMPEEAVTETPSGEGIVTEPPLVPEDSSPDAQSDFFNFNAATSEDTVFNHDVYVKGTLYADKIKANQIEGLELFTNKIGSLQAKLDEEKAAAGPAQPTTASPTPGLDTTGQVSFNNLQAVNLVALAQLESRGGLVVDKDAQFNGKTIFQLLADFKGDVNFDKQPSFNSDAGGSVVIKKDAQKVQVKFTNEYAQKPIVIANWSTDSDNQDEQAQLFEAGYSFLVTTVDQNGFWIYLNKPAAQDLTLNWLATSVKDAKISTSEPNVQ